MLPGMQRSYRIGLHCRVVVLVDRRDMSAGRCDVRRFHFMHRRHTSEQGHQSNLHRRLEHLRRDHMLRGRCDVRRFHLLLCPHTSEHGQHSKLHRRPFHLQRSHMLRGMRYFYHGIGLPRVVVLVDRRGMPGGLPRPSRDMGCWVGRLCNVWSWENEQQLVPLRLRYNRWSLRHASL